MISAVPAAMGTCDGTGHWEVKAFPNDSIGTPQVGFVCYSMPLTSECKNASFALACPPDVTNSIQFKWFSFGCCIFIPLPKVSPCRMLVPPCLLDAIANVLLLLAFLLHRYSQLTADWAGYFNMSTEGELINLEY
jgi:hypothetical protein